jgi:hypothetical protein
MARRYAMRGGGTGDTGLAGARADRWDAVAA